MVHPVDIYVGKRVRFRRKELGMTQTELGNMLDLTFQQIQKYEKGSNRIGASRLFEIAAGLDVEVAYFFEGLNAPGNNIWALFDGEMPPQMIRLIKAFINIDDPDMLESALKFVEGFAAVKLAGDSSVSGELMSTPEGFHDVVLKNKGLSPES